MFFAATAFAATTFTACTQEENVQPKEDKLALTDEVMSQFTELGFDVSDIEAVEGNSLDGGVESGFMLEGDIFISQDNFRKMLDSESHNGPMGEQYRTNNLVSSSNYTIDIIGYTANNSNGLDSKTQTALQWAVNNYNRLNIGLNFNLTFGTNYQSKDMVVYRVSGGGGGSAGFPSGGAPYKWVKINSGTSSYDTNVVEHVITHEIGHSVGLRHTDYFDRSYSCGSGGNEGDGGVGAIHIPGTPTGVDPNSIMLACFSSSEDGEFGSNDVTALEYLY
ncbi:peptidase [Fulvivirga sp. RKSG066]|nr:peptidase [Fulvivirga aurantia]